MPDKLYDLADKIVNMARPNPPRGHRPDPRYDDHIVSATLINKLREAVEEEAQFKGDKLGDLVVLEDRWVNRSGWQTGIYVRAITPDGYKSVDIAVLTPTSLLKWLRMHGEVNKLAENCVGVLLGHGGLNSLDLTYDRKWWEEKGD